MKHLNEERIQALVFGDEGEAPITMDEEAHFGQCNACAELRRQYDFSRKAVAPLRTIGGHQGRTNLAARALAAAKEENRNSWVEGLFRAARFEVPVFALAAAVLLLAGIPRIPSRGTVDKAGEDDARQVAFNFGEDDAPPWPRQSQGEEDWAGWVLLAEETLP